VGARLRCAIAVEIESQVMNGAAQKSAGNH
jgi:hypothetical protein